jgi:DNA primase
MTSEPSREALIAANQDAAEFYRRHLLGPDGEGPRRYLAERGFEAVLEDTPWTVGYAPAAWTGLYDHLSELGYSDQTQLDAGLASISRRGNLIDRFRDRITFGIRDQEDQLLGFTARTRPNGRDPKYLNTPGTTLFDKSSVLFGQGEATTRSLNSASCVLVEGPLDAIAVSLATSATVDALALCGTALTEKHAETLRSAPYEGLVLALDDDAAGVQALENAAAALSSHATSAIRCRHHDPAGLFAEGGPTALSAALSSARPTPEVLLEVHLAKWPDRFQNAEAAIACLREAATTIAKIKPADVAALATQLSHETNLPLPTVTTELSEALRSTTSDRRSAMSHRVSRAYIEVESTNRWLSTSGPTPHR